MIDRFELARMVCGSDYDTSEVMAVVDALWTIRDTDYNQALIVVEAVSWVRSFSKGSGLLESLPDHLISEYLLVKAAIEAVRGVAS